MDIEKILSELTLEEKASLCSGLDFWSTKPVERLGIPSVMMCDATHGLRKQDGEGDHMGLGLSIETVCYPTAAALASSFDREALAKLGHALGEECQAEDVAMLLGPGLNMKRSPLCGRNFEYFSEDPLLAGELAASYVKALQEEGAAACVKHYAANDQETRRMSGSSNMDERTLREIYLPAFEKVVKEGGVRSVMCAYNAVNGTYCAENKKLLTDILRDEWGYEGFVVTDWGAVKDRVKGLLAGLDLEMPGGAGTQDERIVKAVRDGSLEEAALDKAVRNMLKFVSDYQELHREGAVIDRAAASVLSGELAAQCAVLLKNDAVGTKNTEGGDTAGRGSAENSGAAGTENAASAEGSDTAETENAASAEDSGAVGTENAASAEGSDTAGTENATGGQKVLPLKKGAKVAFIGEFAQMPRYQGAGSSHVNVKHPVSALEAVGYDAAVSVTAGTESGTAGSVTAGVGNDAACSTAAAAGNDVTGSAASAAESGAAKDHTQACAVGNIVYARGYDAHGETPDAALMEEAVQAAAGCDAAVIFAGLPDAFETEGCDRDSMRMPENQNALITAVAAVQPNTVVVLHGGAPVELPWLNQVPALLCMYLGGERVGEAAVRLLYGDTVPSGKLAETWPVQLEDNPSYLNFPGVKGQVEYREGVFIGYRYYDKKKMEVNFPFGHGLSYTEFAYSGLTLDRETMDDTDELTVSFRVKNIGKAAAAEAVQLYIRNAAGEAIRPVRELRAFEKVSLQPGEEKTVSFTLGKRAFAYYEPKLPGWFVESGSYGIEVGASSRDIRLSAFVQVNGTQELPIRFTAESTVGDLMQTAKGRAMVQQMMQNSAGSMVTDEAKSDSMKNMGEGGARMMEAMMREMPLGALITFGGISREQLDGMLAMLNA